MNLLRNEIELEFERITKKKIPELVDHMFESSNFKIHSELKRLGDKDL